MGKKDILAGAIGNAFCAPILRSLTRQPSLLCINYHRVAERVEHDDDTIAVTPSELEWQVEWLKRTVPILGGPEVLDILAGRRALAAPAVCLTFDDGYVDNYAAGRMLAERFGVSAFFFIPTGFIDTGVVPPWDRMAYAVKHTERPFLDIPPMAGFPAARVATASPAAAGSALMAMYYRLPPDLHEAFVQSVEAAAGRTAASATGPLFMSWNEILALRDLGHTIGAHTVTHPVLGALPEAAQRLEVGESRRTLQERCGTSVDFFAYPFGKRGITFTERTKAVVAEAGFSGAFTNDGGWNAPGRIDSMDVKRIRVDLWTTHCRFRVRILTRGTVPV